MKKWLIEIYDEDEVKIKSEEVEDNSKFAVKKKAKQMCNKTESADSYSITPLEEGEDG